MKGETIRLNVFKVGFAFTGLAAPAVGFGLPAFRGSPFLHAFDNISTNNLAGFGKGYGCPAVRTFDVKDPVMIAITGLTTGAVSHLEGDRRCL